MVDHYPIRTARPDDLEALVRLEQACFSDPWSPTSVRAALDQPDALGLVIEAGDKVVGYLLARVLAPGAEILTLGVLPAFRRLGLAGALLRECLARLSLLGVTETWLEVRESNQAALQLYQGFGFRVAGMRRAYYRHPTEDALVLRLGFATDA